MVDMNMPSGLFEGRDGQKHFNRFYQLLQKLPTTRWDIQPPDPASVRYTRDFYFDFAQAQLLVPGNSPGMVAVLTPYFADDGRWVETYILHLRTKRWNAALNSDSHEFAAARGEAVKTLAKDLVARIEAEESRRNEDTKYLMSIRDMIIK